MAEFSGSAIGVGGRDGRVMADSGAFELPVHLPGIKGEGTTPEELIAAAWASCYGSSFHFIASQLGLDARDARFHASVDSRPEPRAVSVHDRPRAPRDRGPRPARGAVCRGDGAGARDLPGLETVGRRRIGRQRRSRRRLTLASTDASAPWIGEMAGPLLEVAAGVARAPLLPSTRSPRSTSLSQIAQLQPKPGVELMSARSYGDRVSSAISDRSDVGHQRRRGDCDH